MKLRTQEQFLIVEKTMRYLRKIKRLNEPDSLPSRQRTSYCNCFADTQLFCMKLAPSLDPY